MKDKYDQLKTVFNATLKLNLSEDLKIERLKAELEALKSNDDMPPQRDSKNINFLSLSDFETLRKISKEPRCDTTFIRCALEILYQDNLKILFQKSLHGTEAKTITRKSGKVIHTKPKMPLTPSKVAVLREMFKERVKNATTREFEIMERTIEVSINQMIATSLGNISRAQNQKDDVVL